MSFIPFMFAITSVTSLGSALLPLMWGWAIAAQTVVNHPSTRSNAHAITSTDARSANHR